MGILFLILIILAAVIALMFVVGSLLPRTHRAASRITLQKPVGEVWAVVRDLGALQGSWSPLKTARRLPDENEKEIWEQNSGEYPMRVVIDECRAPNHMLTRVDAEPNAHFGGTWTYDLQQAGNGSQLTVIEQGYVSNPFFRVIMKLMGVHHTADSYLRALGRKLGEEVKPVHVD